ncbi:E3 ubiquitin-protein ligase RNF187 [Tupaia chinensis]|uniref:E3 ubiquitin-protein ligase RNF187 n=1 Tax=Tupaia chinensis TaxID=246437 RepID=L9KWP6_TUPCH|nr:E3 ubiquitin-protein ligase RNF187 [Tupaia chinensis]
MVSVAGRLCVLSGPTPASRSLAEKDRCFPCPECADDCRQRVVEPRRPPFSRRLLALEKAAAASARNGQASEAGCCSFAAQMAARSVPLAPRLQALSRLNASRAGEKRCVARCPVFALSRSPRLQTWLCVLFTVVVPTPN